MKLAERLYTHIGKKVYDNFYHKNNITLFDKLESVNKSEIFTQLVDEVNIKRNNILLSGDIEINDEDLQAWSEKVNFPKTIEKMLTNAFVKGIGSLLFMEKTCRITKEKYQYPYNGEVQYYKEVLGDLTELSVIADQFSYNGEQYAVMETHTIGFIERSIVDIKIVGKLSKEKPEPVNNEFDVADGQNIKIGTYETKQSYIPAVIYSYNDNNVPVINEAPHLVKQYLNSVLKFDTLQRSTKHMWFKAGTDTNLDDSAKQFQQDINAVNVTGIVYDVDIESQTNSKKGIAPLQVVSPNKDLLEQALTQMNIFKGEIFKFFGILSETEKTGTNKHSTQIDIMLQDQTVYISKIKVVLENKLLEFFEALLSWDSQKPKSNLTIDLTPQVEQINKVEEKTTAEEVNDE